MKDPAARTPLKPVADARAEILARARPGAEELVSIADADGRVLRQPIVARRDQPPADMAQMDGYAVRAADAVGGAALKRMDGEAAAGRPATAALEPGAALRIFTGAPMPPGADAVLLQEDAEAIGTTDAQQVRVLETARAGQWIRRRGHDFTAGAAGLAPPRRLTPQDVAFAAAMGAPWVSVSRRPRVTLLALGDELRAPGDPLGPGQIVNSNSFGVAALLKRAGACVSCPAPVPDTLDAVRAAVRAAASDALIVTLGGASEGDHDLARPAFEAEGARLTFHKIAMRPGKPLMAGGFEAGAAVVGLPGNPVSAMVCAHLFLLPLIGAFLGLPAKPAATRAYPLAAPLTEANGPREHYARARLTAGPSGPTATLFSDQDSALLGVLSAADVLAIRPPHDPPRPAGALIDCLPL